MTDYPRLLADLRGRLDRALAHQPPRPERLYSLTLALPGLRLDAPIRFPSPCCYWSRPARGEYRLGMGEALAFNSEGAGRLARLQAFYQHTLDQWDRQASEPQGIDPVFFTGFAFSPTDAMRASWRGLPNATLYLPELLLQRQEGRWAISFSRAGDAPLARAALVSRWMEMATRLIRAASEPLAPREAAAELLDVDDTPSRQTWLERVDLARTAIRRDELEKVVLARRMRVHATHPLDPARLMSKLQRDYPDNLHFAIAREGVTFVASSPERLLSCRQQWISCDALAGTAPASSDAGEQWRLGQALLQDPKALHEHHLVVESLQLGLAPLCRRLQPAGTPRLLRLQGLQHLWTGLGGQLREGVDLFSAAHRLHPSAAVNGAPRGAAGDWLQTHEDLPRGWYTGAGGWLDGAGNGELAVLIRCALLQGEQAELYAGAGITHGSDPCSELRETDLKFAALLQALEEA